MPRIAFNRLPSTVAVATSRNFPEPQLLQRFGEQLRPGTQVLRALTPDAADGMVSFVLVTRNRLERRRLGIPAESFQNPHPLFPPAEVFMPVRKPPEPVLPEAIE